MDEVAKQLLLLRGKALGDDFESGMLLADTQIGDHVLRKERLVLAIEDVLSESKDRIVLHLDSGLSLDVLRD